MNEKILLIDDDKEYGELLKGFLIADGYNVDYYNDEFAGIKQANEQKYDLIIVDLQLTSLSGFQVIELVRKTQPNMKMIVLTSSARDSDEITGLEKGADDYIRKSTSFSIMSQRVKKILIAAKNTPTPTNEILADDRQKLELNIEKHTVKKAGKMIDLAFLEFELLSYFLKHKGEVLKREAILRDVWKIDLDQMEIDPRTVDSHVKKLRSKLGVNSIYSIRGIGYRWCEDD